MKKTFYDTLEIKKNATQDEIRKAYRRHAVNAHPDKGGNAEDMAELNRAYTCLKDPAARLTYDQTGQEPQPDTVDKDAHELLILQLTDALKLDVQAELASDNNNTKQSIAILDHVRFKINTELSRVKQERKKLKDVVARVKPRRDRIKVKQGVNLWHNLIDQELQSAEAVLAKMASVIKVHKRALDILKHYEELVDTTENTVFQVVFSGTVTFGG